MVIELKKNELANFLNFHNLLGYGVEIGVEKGIFSKYLLSNWHGKKLYLIDCWETQSNEYYFDICNVAPHLQEQNYLNAKKNVENFETKCKIIKNYSSQAALSFPDNYFDFIFLDANHSYDFVKYDLCQWYPKLKFNGLFCGTNFINGNFWCGNFGVQSAVVEFANTINKNVIISSDKFWHFEMNKKN